MKSLSQRTQRISPSGIRKMFNMAYGMEDVISFSVGEPDFTAAPRIVEAACLCNQRGQTKYTPNAGLLELREKISEDLRKNDCHIDPDTEVIVTAGGMEALMIIMQVLLDPGDEVIIAEPYWSNYPEQVKLAGGVPHLVKVTEADEFVYHPEALRNAINEHTKAILLNTPANPTGAVTELPVLEQIAAIAKEFDLYVISDEVYQKFLYGGLTHRSIAALPGMKERTIIVNSFSKTYAMTGWRVGYAAGPSEIIGEMTKLHEDISACVNSSAQYGAMAALNGSDEEILKVRDTFDRRRKLLINGINSISGLSCIMPKGAFYAFPNISATGLSSDQFAASLLRSQQVVLIPGTAFGPDGEGFVRLSYATSEENIERGLTRIRRFTRTLLG